MSVKRSKYVSPADTILRFQKLRRKLPRPKTFRQIPIKSDVRAWSDEIIVLRDRKDWNEDEQHVKVKRKRERERSDVRGLLRLKGGKRMKKNARRKLLKHFKAINAKSEARTWACIRFWFRRRKRNENLYTDDSNDFSEGFCASVYRQLGIHLSRFVTC